MSDKIYLGNRLSDLDVGEPSLPVSKVILNVDSQVSYVSGDDTGSTIEQSCPWATQAMADNVLAKLKGFVYKPYTGADALLDPAAELGDALTVGGTYGILAQMGRNLDRQGAASVGAPGTDEIEDEYPYKSKQRKETDRVLAKAYSRISKTAEEIRLEVQNEVEGLSSSFSVALESITARVQGLDSAYTELSVTVDGVTITDENGTVWLDGSGIKAHSVTADQIDATNLSVDAANINGKLTASQIELDLSGSISFTDLTSDLQDELNDTYSIAVDAQSAASDASSLANTAYYNAYSALDGLELLANGQYKGGTFIDGTNIYAPNLYGDTINLLDAYSRVVGTMSLQYSSTYAFDITSNLSLRLQCAAGFNAYLGNGWTFGSGKTAAVLADGDGALLLYGRLGTTDSQNFGYTLPTDGCYNGRIFFLLES